MKFIHLQLGAVLVFFVNAVNAVPFDTELVINGGAESGDTSGWTNNTGVFASMGDAYSQGFGNYAFTAGTGSTVQSMSQSIDVSSNAIDIDNGLLEMDFSVQLQSRSAGNAIDRAIAEVFFRDVTNNVLQSFYFEDTINTHLFDWDLYGTSAAVSSGTRSIEILLSYTRNGGSSSDGFVDAVSMQLSSSNTASVPEPQAMGLLIAGLSLIQLRRRKA